MKILCHCIDCEEIVLDLQPMVKKESDVLLESLGEEIFLKFQCHLIKIVLNVNLI